MRVLDFVNKQTYSTTVLQCLLSSSSVQGWPSPSTTSGHDGGGRRAGQCGTQHTTYSLPLSSPAYQPSTAVQPSHLPPHSNNNKTQLRSNSLTVSRISRSFSQFYYCMTMLICWKSPYHLTERLRGYSFHM